MSDLINREKAIKAITELPVKIDNLGYAWMIAFDVLKQIDEVPPAESERKIIYCKDCKFAHLTSEGEVKYCDVWFPETKTYLNADDFCSSAEKRGEECQITR